MKKLFLNFTPKAVGKANVDFPYLIKMLVFWNLPLEKFENVSLVRR
jgi:hypothetical protein